jgi:hypothetical protein
VTELVLSLKILTLSPQPNKNSVETLSWPRISALLYWCSHQGTKSQRLHKEFAESYHDQNPKQPDRYPNPVPVFQVIRFKDQKADPEFFWFPGYPNPHEIASFGGCPKH